MIQGTGSMTLCSRAREIAPSTPTASFLLSRSQRPMFSRGSFGKAKLHEDRHALAPQLVLGISIDRLSIKMFRRVSGGSSVSYFRIFLLSKGFAVRCRIVERLRSGRSRRWFR